MNTSKTVHGGANLALDLVDGVTDIVEGMYRNIAALPFPFDKEPTGSAPGIAGAVYAAIRGTNGLIRDGANTAMPALLRAFEGLAERPSGPHGQAIVAALNGVCGDHLARTNNALAIPMTMRVLLPRAESADSADAQAPAFGHLFDNHRDSVELFPSAQALEDKRFEPNGKILLCLHGLCMNDIEWTAHGHNHGIALADEFGYTPVFAHYNTGLHASENGEQLFAQINGLVEQWPVEVESITIIGFSMGGLIARSALSLAEQSQANWLEKVDKAFYVGTPHHGSALERGGYWLQKSFTFTPYTAPLAALGKVRSAGITDLRHGNILKQDWCDHDEHEDNADHRKPVPLAKGIEHFAIGGSLSASSDEKLKSDGLVHPNSALGKHSNPELALAFPAENTAIFDKVGHLSMLSDRRVFDALKGWM